MKITEIMEEILKDSSLVPLDTWILQEDIQEIHTHQWSHPKEKALHFVTNFQEVSSFTNPSFLFCKLEKLPTLAPLCLQLKKQNLSYAVFPLSSYDLIHEKVTSLMNMEMMADRFTLEILSHVLSGGSVDDVLHKLEKELHNPLILIDAGFKMISWSTGIQITDPVWSVNIQRGYCSYEFIQAVHKLEEAHPFPSSSLPFEVVCEASPHIKICCKIFHQGTLIAYLILLNLHGLELSHKYILQKSTVALCEVLKKSIEYSHIFASQKEALFLDLLHGIGGDHLTLRLRMQNIYFDKPKLLLSILPTKSLLALSAEAHVRQQLEKIFPDALYCEDQGNLYVLCDEDAMGRLSEKKEQSLSHLQGKGIENIAFSRSLLAPQDVASGYGELSTLRQIIKLLGEENYFYVFQEYSFYVLLMAMSKNTWSSFLHPALGILESADARTQGELYQTLHTFLQCESQMMHTADRLKIHRNTLTYRLHKIIELTGIRLDSEEERFSLRMSFRVHRLLNSEAH